MPHSLDALDAELAQAARAYRERRDPAPLEHGIRALKALLAHPEWGGQSARRQCRSLDQGAGLLLGRFKAGGAAGDLSDAVALLRVAAARLEPEDPSRGSVLGNLGVALRNASEQFNDPAALDEAIEVQRSACALPGDALACCERPLNLAMALFARLETVGVTDDIEEMRMLLRTAHAVAPTVEHAAQVSNNHAIVERLLFERGGDVLDLERAVSLAETALSRLPVGHPRRATRLNNLGMCLGTRLAVHGRVEDGRRAVDALREACGSVSTSHVEAGLRSMNLGSAHLALFEVAHDRADLEAAIQAFEAADARLPPNHAYKGWVLTALSQGLTGRARLEGDPGLLDRSVDAAFRAVAEARSTPRIKPKALGAAADALLERSRRQGAGSRDRVACRMALDEALKLTPGGSVDGMTFELLRIRARGSGARADGDRAALAEVVRDGSVSLGEMGRRIGANRAMRGLRERMNAVRRELVAYAVLLGDATSAIELSESGKATALIDDVRRSERVPRNLSGEEAETYRSAVTRLQALNALLASSTDPVDLTSRADLAKEAPR